LVLTMSEAQRVELPYPPSLNNAFSQTRGGKRFKSRRYTAWRTAAMWTIKAAGLRKATGPVHLLVTVCPPDKRARDIDNLLKPIVDSLVASGVIADDSNRYVLKIVAQWALPPSKTRPYALVEIQPVTVA
jgi:crossover junction endodeoxyribonuclease RusA